MATTTQNQTLSAQQSLHREIEYLRQDMAEIREVAPEWATMSENAQGTHDMDWSQSVARWNYIRESAPSDFPLDAIVQELRQMVPILQQLKLEIPQI